MDSSNLRPDIEHTVPVTTPLSEQVSQATTQNQSVQGATAKDDPLQFLKTKVEELEKDNFNYRERERQRQTEEAKRKAEEQKRIEAAAIKRGEWEQVAKIHEEKIRAYEPELERLKAYQDGTQTLLAQQLATLTHAERESFDRLFGDIVDPLQRLNKLQIWKTSKPIVPSQGNPSPVNFPNIPQQTQAAAEAALKNPNITLDDAIKLKLSPHIAQMEHNIRKSQGF